MKNQGNGNRQSIGNGLRNGQGAGNVQDEEWV